MKIKQFEIEEIFTEHKFFSHEFWKAIYSKYDENSFVNNMYLLGYNNLDIESNQLKSIEFHTPEFSCKFIKEAGLFKCETFETVTMSSRIEISFLLMFRRIIPISMEEIDIETKRLQGSDSAERIYLPSIYKQMLRHQNISISGELKLI